MTTTSSNRIAFSYYGGKASQLSWLLKQLETPHRSFVETCGGSLAVLLNKEPVKHEIINDSAEDVADFGKAMRDHQSELIAAIRNSPAGELEFKRCIDASPSDDIVERARRFYVVVSQSFNNAIGLGKKGPGYSFATARNYKSARHQDKLEAVAERMRDVTVEKTDANRLIKRLSTENAIPCSRPILFYIDPPYTKDSRVAVGHYLHDSFDHAKLLEIITAAPEFCKFCVSGYANPLYDEILSDWYRVENRVAVYASSKRRGKFNTEVVWRNYQVDALKQSRML